MIALFFMLGKYFTEKTSVYDIGTLFTGTSIALIFCYLFFSRNLKTSIHMIGMRGMIGFILNFSYFYQINMIIPLLIAFILSGIVGLIVSYDTGFVRPEFTFDLPRPA